LCKKGDKCKFSHDPDVEKRSAKRNIYADNKDIHENDNMDDWDDEKLKEVVSKKHGAEVSNQTEIVSKSFRFHPFFDYVGKSWHQYFFHPLWMEWHDSSVMKQMFQYFKNSFKASSREDLFLV